MGVPDDADFKQKLSTMLQSLQKSSTGPDISGLQQLLGGATGRDLADAIAAHQGSAARTDAPEIQMEQVYHKRIERLEKKLRETNDANTKLRSDLQLQRRQHEEETERLQRDIQEELHNIKDRQDAVDKARLQAANEAILAKVQLSTTVISDSKYAELKQIPADQRSLADEVKLVIHEGLRQAKQDNEQLRLEAQTMREAQQRTLQEAAALRRDASRRAAAEAAAIAERDNAAAANSGRMEQLQRDAEQASLAAEINRAKAAQYDNMAAHAQHMQQELRQLTQQAEARQDAEQRAASLTTSLKDREHKLQLASMDAAYLKREVASLEARLQAVQQERDSMHAEATAAKEHHTDMCSSLLQGDGGSRVALERRIDEEVARVREAARADVASVREEARAALERETRLLRDMRDRAQHGADSAAAELKACRQELVDAATRFRGLQHKADVESSTATAEIRIMAADADRAKMMAAEREEHALQLQAENELLQQKVRVLTDTLCCQAAAGPQTGGPAQPPGGVLQPLQADAQNRSPSPGASMGDGGAQRLRRERDALLARLQSAQQAAGAATAEVRRVRAACAAASADTFLAQELQRLEAQAEAAAQEAHEGQAQLQKQAEELKLCRRRLRHVQGDLQRVLEQRRSFDSLLEQSNMARGAPA